MKGMRQQPWLNDRPTSAWLRCAGDCGPLLLLLTATALPQLSPVSADRHRTAAPKRAESYVPPEHPSRLFNEVLRSPVPASRARPTILSPFLILVAIRSRA